EATTLTVAAVAADAAGARRTAWAAGGLVAAQQAVADIDRAEQRPDAAALAGAAVAAVAAGPADAAGATHGVVVPHRHVADVRERGRGAEGDGVDEGAAPA